MVVNELSENIVKYSSDVRGTLEFELWLAERQPRVRVCTQNPADARHRAEVEKLVEQVNSAVDPAKLYEAMVAASGDRAGSGLGLVRIRAEAGLDLRCWVSGDQLGLEAAGPVEAKRTGQ
jgi:hypothetical protein